MAVKQTIGDWDVLRRLGERGERRAGVAPARGRSYLVRRRVGEVAARELHLIDPRPGDPEALLQQVQHFARLHHPALPDIVESFLFERRVVVVMRHDDGVGLDRLKGYLDRDQERLADAAIWYIGFRLTAALTKAHLARAEDGSLRPLVHGHLSLNDVLITWDGDVRLMGLCPGLQVLPVDAPPPSRAWMPPEVRRGQVATASSDAYAAALILRSLLTGRPPPTPGASLLRLEHARDDLPKDVARAIDKALDPDPGARTTCGELEQRLETLVQVTAGQSALRECMELYQALWGLWSVAAPDTWTTEEPLPLSKKTGDFAPVMAEIEELDRIESSFPPPEPEEEAEPEAPAEPENEDASEEAAEPGEAAESEPEPEEEAEPEPDEEAEPEPEPDAEAEPREAAESEPEEEAEPKADEEAEPEEAAESEPEPDEEAEPEEAVEPEPEPDEEAEPETGRDSESDFDPAPLPEPVSEPRPSTPDERGASPALIAVVVGVVIGLVLWFATRGGDERDPAPRPKPSVAPVAKTTRSSSTAVPTPAPTPAPSAAPAATATTTAAPSATASATPPEGEDPALAAMEPWIPRYEASEKAKELPYDRGLLLVRSATETGVAVYGKLVGRTNAPASVPCRPYNWELRDAKAIHVRLAEGPTDWRSEGRTVAVRCRELTVVRIDADPSE